MTAATPDPAVVEQFVTACHSDLAKVKSLLEQDPSLLNTRSQVNECGLEAAAHMGQRAIAEFLLAQGAPLDICTAVMLGRQDGIREMVAALSDLSGTAGAHGIPVMTYAAINGSVETAELLFGKGAVVNGQPGQASPLHMAVYFDRADMVAWLLEHDADLDAAGPGGATPLQLAEQQKREKPLAILRKHVTS